MSKTDAPAIGDNSMSATARKILRGAVRSLEELDAEARDLNERRRDVYAEVKAKGLNPGIVRMMMRRLAMDPAALEERDATLLAYEAALRTPDPGTAVATRAGGGAREAGADEAGE